MSTADFRLYLVVGARPDLPEAVAAAIRGGVTMVQVRFKDLPDRDALALAEPVAGMCRERRVPLIVNDRIDLALILGADGVHLGVDDLPLEYARRLAPPGYHIGYSPETDEQLCTAAARGASYLGIGPVYTTTTKPDAGSPLGLAAFAHRCAATSLPVVGIGGIDAANAASVIDQGAVGVAVSAAILGANDIEAAARAIRASVDGT